MEQISDMNNDKNVTIKALRKETLNKMSTLLNPVKHFTNEDKLSRDWRGLAALCDIDNTSLPSIQCSDDQMNLVLEKWYKKDKENCTVARLLEFMEKIDRFDIIEDITPFIDEDLRLYRENPNGYNPEPLNPDTDFEILTHDDDHRKNLGQGPQIYDAFVLFADDDIHFATQLMKTMEEEYGLKFCSKDRDLVGGVFEHSSIIKLITERCNRLIVVLSTAFLNSAQNKFLYSFAQSLENGQRTRKIIPCTYKDVKLPCEYTIYFTLDYKKSIETNLYNFWEKLYSSVKVSTSNSGVPAIQISPVNENNNENISVSSLQLTPAITTTANNNNNNGLRSALHHNSNSVRSHDHHSVTFNSASLGDLSSIHQQNSQEETISASISANSLGVDSTNLQRPKKKSFFKKIFSNLHGSKRTKVAATAHT